MVYQQTKLRKWIPLSKLNWSQLSANKNAIHILEKNLDAKNKLKK